VSARDAGGMMADVFTIEKLTGELRRFNESIEKLLAREDIRINPNWREIADRNRLIECSVCFGWFSLTDMLPGIKDGARFCKGCGYQSDADRFAFEEMDEEIRREFEVEEAPPYEEE
jgi:hypothetical protein